jgi:hypothetical protein
MYERCRISHCSGIRQERRPATRMNSEPRKTDSWFNAIIKKEKERTLESGRLQSHVKLIEKKYIFIWLCNMVKQNST